MHFPKGDQSVNNGLILTYFLYLFILDFLAHEKINTEIHAGVVIVTDWGPRVLHIWTLIVLGPILIYIFKWFAGDVVYSHSSRLSLSFLVDSLQILDSSSQEFLQGEHLGQNGSRPGIQNQSTSFWHSVLLHPQNSLETGEDVVLASGQHMWA